MLLTMTSAYMNHIEVYLLYWCAVGWMTGWTSALQKSALQGLWWGPCLT